MKLLIILGFVLALNACTNEDESLRALKAMGMTEIKFHGHGWFDCDGSSCTEFSATNPQGARVKGVVDCNVFGCGKNCTVRF